MLHDPALSWLPTEGPKVGELAGTPNALVIQIASGHEVFFTAGTGAKAWFRIYNYGPDDVYIHYDDDTRFDLPAGGGTKFLCTASLSASLVDTGGRATVGAFLIG